MISNDPALEALVSGINGTAGFLSILISRKSGLVLFLVVSTVIMLKVML